MALVVAQGGGHERRWHGTGQVKQKNMPMTHAPVDQSQADHLERKHREWVNEIEAVANLAKELQHTCAEQSGGERVVTRACQFLVTGPICGGWQIKTG